MCLENNFPFNNIENTTDFLAAASDKNNTHDDVTISDLNKKLFTPFELDDSKISDLLNDNDPDSHYYNTASCTRIF